jgi:hypothetical protein
MRTAATAAGSCILRPAAFILRRAAFTTARARRRGPREASIPYAGIRETSSNCWRFSVINEAGCWVHLVRRLHDVALLVPRLTKKGELVLHGNSSCSRVYNGCHTSFDKLLLAEKRAAHDGGLRGTDVRVSYQYHVDGALVFYVPGR